MTMDLADPGIHLFLDDDDLESRENLVRVVHAPVLEHEPVLKTDRAWEGGAIACWGSVFRDPAFGKYRMWYQTCNKRWWRSTKRFLICYAESDDGVSWVKPNLGLFEFDGSRDNNIVYGPGIDGILDNPAVLVNPRDAEPDRRYLMSAYIHKPRDPSGNVFGLWTAVSADGLNWRFTERPVVRAGDRNFVLWDPVDRRFMLTTRTPKTWFDDRRAAVKQQKVRLPHRDICLFSSLDFRTWMEHGQVLADDDWDPADCEYHGMQPLRYGCRFVGLLERLYTLRGATDVSLVCSRDGLTWAHVGERAPVPGGEPLFFTNNPPDVQDGRLRFWYSIPVWAAQTGMPGRARGGTMGVASWRWEGFVSLDARTRGKLITRPFALANRGLWLNYEIRPGGSVRAGLLDPAGKPLEDFRISDSPWWRGNEVRQVLTWNGRHPASDRPVKLALDLHRARVYGYGLSNPIRGC